jgi:hypothetical protein
MNQEQYTDTDLCLVIDRIISHVRIHNIEFSLFLMEDYKVP